MTQEEKAKRYDEAIEIAGKIHNEHKAQPFDVMLKVFPELKESEDEKIRKEILDYIIKGSESLYDVQQYGKERFEKWIAWLEKQGEHAKFCDSTQVGDKVTRNEDGVLVNLSQLKRVAKKDEKQGEQKLANKVEPKFKVGDIIRLKDGDGLEWTVEGVLNNGYYTIVCADRDDFIQLDDKWELVEQKPADKVEPKFKVGDWISGYYTNYKVLSVNNDGYLVEDVDGNKINILFENEKFHHLFTIADAKDGDVISWDDSKCIAIFKNIYHEDSFNSYGFVGGCTGTFESRMSYHDIEGAHPATKEQRDLLFQKMKEAGYERSDKDRKLIKIVK